MHSSGKKDPQDPPPSDPFAEKLLSLLSPSSALVIAKHFNQSNSVSVSAMLSSGGADADKDKETNTPQSLDSFEESKSGATETRLSMHESTESSSQNTSQNELALSITDISLKVMPNKIELPNENDIPESTDIQSSPSEVGPWSRHGKKYLASKS